jgi:hypothetical protein
MLQLQHSYALVRIIFNHRTNIHLSDFRQKNIRLFNFGPSNLQVVVLTQIIELKVIIRLDYRTVRGWHFLFFITSVRKYVWVLMIGCCCRFTNCCLIPAFVIALCDNAAHNVPVASAVDTVVTDVTGAVYVPWVSPFHILCCC